MHAHMHMHMHIHMHMRTHASPALRGCLKKRQPGRIGHERRGSRACLGTDGMGVGGGAGLGPRDVALTAAASRVATLALAVSLDWLLWDYDRAASGGQSWPTCDGAPGDAGARGGFEAALKSSVVWDAAHFVRICQCGYRSEHHFAFQPLWPWVMARLAHVASALRLVPRGGEEAVAACALSGLVAANAFFVLAAVSLFRLGRAVGYPPHIAARATALFCWCNPATAFYSYAYSESLYAWLTFEGFARLLAPPVAPARGMRWRAAWDACSGTVLLMLATLTRANGITAAVVVLAVHASRALRRPRTLLSFRSNRKGHLRPVKKFLRKEGKKERIKKKKEDMQ